MTQNGDRHWFLSIKAMVEITGEKLDEFNIKNFKPEKDDTVKKLV